MKRCLVADTSEVIRKVVVHYLDELGLEALEAENAQDALKLCKEMTPDVLILDWHLAGMTTVEFLSALRFAGPAKKPFIIYFTTDNDHADLTRIYSAGADTYLLKPFDRRSFVEKLGGITQAVA